MAALDFPNSPTNGQQYSAPNGAIYTYDGTAWTVSGVLSTGSAAGGDLSGTYPNPSVIPAAHSKWTDTGATLTPTDQTKAVAVPGGAAGAGTASVLLGSNAAKARLQTVNTTQPPYVTLTTNHDAGTGAQDDATKPSWQLYMNSSIDEAALSRRPAGGAMTAVLKADNAGNLFAPGFDGSHAELWAYGAGTATGGCFKGRGARGTNAAPTPSQAGDLLAYVTGAGCYSAGSFSDQVLVKLMAAETWTATARGTQLYINTTPTGTTSASSGFYFNPNGDFQITGANAYKASGTAWANPSDPRLKDDVTPYPYGLADILQLEPISYTLNGLAGTPAGLRACGFDAETVRAIFPDCVTTTRQKLHPDDEEETDVLALDIHGILIALVNAVKELAAKVDHA